MDDGRLLYRLKHRWRDGTSHVVFEPRELLEKLAALVPPPRLHLIRYHGILGPCASERDRVVAVACEASSGSALSGCPAHARGERAEPASDSLHSGAALAEECTAAPGDPGELSTLDTRERLPALPAPHPAPSLPRPRRLAWADLLRRVFAIDVLRCRGCGGRMRILAAIHPPEATQAILASLGLPVRAPPTRPARRDDDLEATPEAWDYEPAPDG